jgi:hypothetical protein
MLHRKQTFYLDEFVVAARPAQAQLAGPAQVKIYKTFVQVSLVNLHECTADLQSTQKFEHIV